MIWNELYETHSDDSNATLLMVRKGLWFVDVSWRPACGYWLRVLKDDCPAESDPWADPLYQFETSSLNQLANEVERVLERGIY